MAGANSFRFSGRFDGRRLAPGRYRLVIAAVNRIGISSLPARVAFRIVR
jgi:predicted phage tail protein